MFYSLFIFDAAKTEGGVSMRRSVCKEGHLNYKDICLSVFEKIVLLYY
jgi:hypothetical protein